MERAVSLGAIGRFFVAPRDLNSTSVAEGTGPCGDIFALDCAAGRQSRMHQISAGWGTAKVTTLGHSIANHSPFGVDRIANGNRTGTQVSKGADRCKILCCSFVICNLRTRLGLQAQNRTGGSNPSRSATQSGLQRIARSISRKMRETCPFFAILPRQIGLERTDCS